MLATFSKTTALISEQGMTIPDLSKTLQFFRSHSSVFISKFLVALLRLCFRKQPEKLNLQSFFKSKRSFAGYFQWSACTYLHKQCSGTRYSNAKLFENISNLSSLLTSLFSPFLRFFYLYETLWCLLLMKCVHLLPKNM